MLKLTALGLVIVLSVSAAYVALRASRGTWWLAACDYSSPPNGGDHVPRLCLTSTSGFTLAADNGTADKGDPERIREELDKLDRWLLEDIRKEREARAWPPPIEQPEPEVNTPLCCECWYLGSTPECRGNTL